MSLSVNSLAHRFPFLSSYVSTTGGTMTSISRRNAILGIGATALSSIFMPNIGQNTFAAQRIVKNGRLKQSVSRWCYGKIPLDDFAKSVADMGLTAIDLLE